jgi:hypothetical protein
MNCQLNRPLVGRLFLQSARGQLWSFVGTLDGKPIGWVFDNYLRCGVNTLPAPSYYNNEEGHE